MRLDNILGRMDPDKIYWPRVWDSTAIMTYKACPRKFFYRIVIAHVPLTKYSYFAFGSAYHKFREVLEKTYMAGEEDPIECMKPALQVASDYCDKHLVTPTEGKWKFQSKARLLASCAVAFEWWKEEKKAENIEVLAVEQPFRILVPSTVIPDGIVIAGRADQIIKVYGRVWGRDFKTTSKASGKDLAPYYSNTMEPNDQFTRYTYGETILQFGELKDNPRDRVSGQYVEVLLNSSTAGPSIHALSTSRSVWQLEEWLTEQDYWVENILKSKETNIFPKNEKSCDFCEYRRVCTSKSESAMLTELKNNYNIEEWDCEKEDI